MMPLNPERDVVDRARRAARDSDAPLVLAVSGGLDSMSLLDAMATAARSRIAAVATFDHATGLHSARAVAHVVREARRLGLPVVTGRMPDDADQSNGLEAMWRAARLSFLRATAATFGARVVTAHTRDDQIETVLMREMRGSGARGLAGLAVANAIVRPFLDVSRATLEAYARTRGLTWLDDPSNASLAFLRNRVRHQLLPALRRADPSIDDALWSIGSGAAAWRADLESAVDACVRYRHSGERALVVAASELADYDRDSLTVLWGALAGRVGLALDRRGTQRCASFTMSRARNGGIPLSGGWRLEAGRGDLMLRRAAKIGEGTATLPTEGALEWGGFRFSVVEDGQGDNGWSAAFVSSEPVLVRPWRAGDRLGPSLGQGRRRVTRYLSDAGVMGSDRAGWPVVVQGEEIVWIPGVRRSDAATAPSGRPARHYLCERAHG
jgi:tRNA(Ile)-lysidine synthase